MLFRSPWPWQFLRSTQGLCNAQLAVPVLRHGACGSASILDVAGRCLGAASCKASPLVGGRPLRGEGPYSYSSDLRRLPNPEVSVEPVDRESRENELRITCLGQLTLSRRPNRVPVHAWQSAGTLQLSRPCRFLTISGAGCTMEHGAYNFQNRKGRTALSQSCDCLLQPRVSDFGETNFVT